MAARSGGPDVFQRESRHRDNTRDGDVALEREETLPDDLGLIPDASASGASGASTPSLASSQYMWQELEDRDGDMSQVMMEHGEVSPVDTPPDSNPISINIDSQSSGTSKTSLGKRKASLASLLEGESSKKSPRTTSFDNVSTYSQDEEYPVIIAHCAPLIPYLYRKELPYCVTWEIARYLSLGGELPDSFTPEVLESLHGSNAQSAAKVSGLLLGKDRVAEEDSAEDDLLKTAFAREQAAKDPSNELDAEENALNSGPYNLLGFDADNPGYYGGKIVLSGRLKDISNTKVPDYKISLDPLALGASNRIKRRWGSRRILTIKIPSRINNKPGNGVSKFFQRPFIINGQVFRMWWGKDNNKFLFQTNEVFENGKITTPSAPSRICGPTSIIGLLNWLNPFDFNKNQPIRKYVTRAQIVTSTSVPGLMIKPGNIKVIPDVVSSEGSDMTDGCGFGNRAVFLRCQAMLGLDLCPTAIQLRLEGAKGLLCSHPDAAIFNQVEPYVELRPSQIKINYDPTKALDPAMCIVDVLKTSHMRTPIRISSEVIINLAENGVPHKVFVELLRKGLQEQVEGLTTWDGPEAMFDLWCAVSRAEGVMSARLAREAAGEARARGHSSREAEEDNDFDADDDIEDLDAAKSTAWWGDEISGCPSSLAETVMYLLDSGFTPSNCAVLREKLGFVIKSTINNYVLRYRLDVPMSCSAWLIPDPFGVLGPDEVHCKSSRREFRTHEGMETDIIEGDILLTRNPCKLPTDVRKLKAVRKAELTNYVDVIVLSIDALRRIADYLGGGDYDGDKGLLIYDPDIVNAFLNADLRFSVEPENFADNFESNTETVSDVLSRAGTSPTAMNRELQKYLGGDRQDPTLVGKYSSWHDQASYILGYDHADTIRLVYLFCAVLDAIKTGKIIKRKVVAQDSLQFQGRGPRWKETEEEADRAARSNLANPSRAQGLSTFVMNTIRAQGNKEAAILLSRMKDLFQASDRQNPIQDPDLIAPWIDAEKRGAEYAARNNHFLLADLDVIQKHVEDEYAHHKLRKDEAIAKHKKRTGKKFEKLATFTDLPIEDRQDVLRASARAFASGPRPESVFLSKQEISRLRASYAYKYDAEQSGRIDGRTGNRVLGWSRFPWDVAMRELCNIKAEAMGTTKTVQGSFYNRFTMKSSSWKLKKGLL